MAETCRQPGQDVADARIERPTKPTFVLLVLKRP